eukprot:m.58948 g.58948  ORF g.58948 m.58948 type:complete len:68 (-) comp11736_c0_seq4:464-667(-)
MIGSAPWFAFCSQHQPREGDGQELQNFNLSAVADFWRQSRPSNGTCMHKATLWKTIIMYKYAHTHVR